MTIVALVTSLFIFTFLLIKSADIVVISLRRLSRSTHTGAFVLSALLLALATSFPELFVGITSALEKAPNLSLGIVLGSNIANLSLMTGIAALTAGRIYVNGNFIKKDVVIALVAGLLPIFLALDGNLSRVDGLILLSVYLGYATSFFKHGFIEIAERYKAESFTHRFFRVINHIDINRTKEAGKLFIGIALMLASADIVVLISKNLALAINIPVYVIGLVVVAIGTSLPELAFSLRSLKDKEPKMFFGNLLGSTIANSTLVVGTTVVISPITDIPLFNYLNSALFFVITGSVFWWFIKSKLRLERWEAGVLVAIYILFALIEFI